MSYWQIVKRAKKAVVIRRWGAWWLLGLLRGLGFGLLEWLLGLRGRRLGLLGCRCIGLVLVGGWGLLFLRLLVGRSSVWLLRIGSGGRCSLRRCSRRVGLC